MITRRPPPEPSERSKEINALAAVALQGADDVRIKLRTSIEAARKCGLLLLEEKEDVSKRLGRGTWESYFEIAFSKTVPRTTAWRWMKMVKSGNPMGLTGVDAQPNMMRDGMLALDLFPPKEHVATADAGELAHMPALQMSSHLPLINRFAAWHSKFREEVGQHISEDQRMQLMKDFAPLLAFCDELRLSPHTH